MNINELGDVLLDINIPGITEALVEVMGESYRQKITNRIADTTIFGRGSNILLVDAIKIKIQSLIEYGKALPNDEHRDVKIQELRIKIQELQKAIKQVEECIENYKTLEKKKNEVVGKMVEERKKALPIQTPVVLKEFVYFCFYNGNLDDYYFKAFAPYFGNPKTQEELCENPDFKILLQFAKEVHDVIDQYDKQLDNYLPLNILGIEKIGAIGLKEHRTPEDIKRKFLSPFSYVFSEGSTMMEEGIDGKMKVLVGINLDHHIYDRSIIHELIHAICSFEKDGQYRSGFCFKNDLQVNLNINEACVDWLAIKATKKYLEKNAPMYNPEIVEGVYGRCFGIAGDFLETYEREIIEAIMSDNPLSFKEKIGANNFDRINNIIRKAMEQEELTAEECSFMEGMGNPTA